MDEQSNVVGKKPFQPIIEPPWLLFMPKDEPEPPTRNAERTRKAFTMATKSDFE